MLFDSGVPFLEYPTMLQAKAFVRDGEDVLFGTCNLDAWSLKRCFAIDIRVRRRQLAAQFDDRFAAPCESVSGPGRRATGVEQQAKARVFAAISPLL
jgi:phosphatidylserine/phosphatidylglycerophosphate/cardiolipin synthase-like enzyme